MNQEGAGWKNDSDAPKNAGPWLVYHGERIDILWRIVTAFAKLGYRSRARFDLFAFREYK